MTNSKTAAAKIFGFILLESFFLSLSLIYPVVLFAVGEPTQNGPAAPASNTPTLPANGGSTISGSSASKIPQDATGPLSLPDSSASNTNNTSNNGTEGANQNDTQSPWVMNSPFGQSNVHLKIKAIGNSHVAKIVLGDHADARVLWRRVGTWDASTQSLTTAEGKVIRFDTATGRFTVSVSRDAAPDSVRHMAVVRTSSGNYAVVKTGKIYFDDDGKKIGTDHYRNSNRRGIPRDSGLERMAVDGKKVTIARIARNGVDTYRATIQMPNGNIRTVDIKNVTAFTRHSDGTFRLDYIGIDGHPHRLRVALNPDGTYRLIRRSPTTS